MGAWGTDILDDDETSDLRGGLEDLLVDGVSPTDASAKVVLDWDLSLLDTDEEGRLRNGRLWLALAVAQHEFGVLQPDVRDRAIAFVEAGGDVADFETEYQAARRSALRKAAKLLMSKPKKVRLPEKFKAQRTAWQLGDVLGYRLRSGRWIVVRVVGISESGSSRDAHVELLAWQGGTPTTESVRSLKRLQTTRFEEHLKDVWKTPESPYQGEQLERWAQAWRSSPRRAEDEARIRRIDGIMQLPTEHEEDFDASRVIALGNQTCEALGGHELGGEFPYPWSRFEELLEDHFDLR
jgi:hypothetical protein